MPAAGSVPLRWGLGDFLWIYVAGIVASVVGASIGFALTGDTSGHIGAVTTALSTFGQFGTWFAGVVYIARSKGRSVRDDFGLTLQLRDWWAPFAGLGLFLLGSALIYPLVNIVNAHQQVVDDLDKAGGAKLAVFAVVAALVAPVCEELLFRGLLLRALRRRMSPADGRDRAGARLRARASDAEPDPRRFRRGSGAVLAGRGVRRGRGPTGRSLGLDHDAHRLQPRHDAFGPLTGGLGRRGGAPAGRQSLVRVAFTFALQLPK